MNSSSGGKETYEETIWVSLGDSYGNVVYFFLKAIFISPVDISAGAGFNSTKNLNISKDCGDEILTANITDINREALVNITYSQELYNAMFETPQL